MAKILIVDDDKTITNLMTMLLSMEGHQAIVVNDSTKTLETANSTKPDLVTLDLMMPELDGFTLCGLLHEDPRFAQIPVLIVSARDDAESKKRCMQAGAKRYITKPFNVDEFLQAIKELTNSH